MDNHAPGISARGIGKQIAAAAEEVNFRLKDQGFFDGNPGAYDLTPKDISEIASPPHSALCMENELKVEA